MPTSEVSVLLSGWKTHHFKIIYQYFSWFANYLPVFLVTHEISSSFTIYIHLSPSTMNHHQFLILNVGEDGDCPRPGQSRVSRLAVPGVFGGPICWGSYSQVEKCMESSGGGPSMGAPQQGLSIKEHPFVKWMIFRGTPMTQETSRLGYGSKHVKNPGEVRLM